MIEVILFESEHLGRVLMVMIEPFKVLLCIAKVFCVLINYVNWGPSLFHDLASYICIVVCLG